MNFRIQTALFLIMAMAPVSASAQVGRLFVSAEAFVSASRGVHVGKILKLERVGYAKPLTSKQQIGKPYRLVFEVSETIRGDDGERLELILSLQSTHELEYMRDHAIEIMLVAAPARLTRFPGAEIGIEQHGKRVDGQWYHFRVLTPVEVPDSDPDRSIASQININYDNCRMFASDLEIVVGREAILKQVRAFAKAHPKALPSVMLRVPNEFGALCGDPNAHCGIILPVIDETKATLVALKADSGLILRRIESRDEAYNRSLVTDAVENALTQFAKASEEQE